MAGRYRRERVALEVDAEDRYSGTRVHALRSATLEAGIDAGHAIAATGGFANGFICRLSCRWYHHRGKWHREPISITSRRAPSGRRLWPKDGIRPRACAP